MVNLPFSGHTNPTLSLAELFISMGHNVTYVHSPDWQEKIQTTGAAFVPYDDYSSNLSHTKKELKSWGAAYKTVKRIGKDYDCLIYEMLFLPGKALADELEIPSFRLFSTFALNEEVINDFGKTGGWYMTKIFELPFLYRWLSKRIKKSFHLNYPTIIEELTRNSPELNFTYTMKEFQLYEAEFDKKHFKFVGPPQDLKRSDDNSLDLSYIGSPLIYISLGTLVNSSTSFFKKCIQAFEDQPFSVIVSIGHRVKKETLGDIPGNIYIYPYVPQLAVLKKADLFITHGGMNSVNEAIYYGVPMVVIPMGNDQPTVAKQVDRLQLGKQLSKKKLRSQMLLDKAVEVLNDHSIRSSVKEFQMKSENTGGNKEVTKCILDELNCKD